MNKDNTRNNFLRIGYHRISTTGLEPSQQKELDHRFGERGISVDFEAYSPEPRGGLPTANILGEPSKLIVEIVGKLTDRTLLAACRVISTTR